MSRRFVGLVAVVGCARAVDLEAEREALLAADRARADDAQVLPAGQAAVDGKAAIRGMVAGGMEAPAFSVTWEPEEAVVGPSGAMGYTIGASRFTVPNMEGGIDTLDDRYVTVWRKEADGRWRCVIDIFNAGPGADLMDGDET